MFSTDTLLRIVCALPCNAVIFGTGAVTVLSVPSFSVEAKTLLPIVMVASCLLTPLAAAVVAPRLRLCLWGRRAWKEGDWISGGTVPRFGKKGS